MRRAVPLLLLAAGAALFFAWRAARPDPPPPLPLASPAEPTAPVKPPEVAARAQRTQVEVPAGIPAAPPHEPVPIEDRAPALPDDAALAAKYAGWTRAQLEPRLEELETAYLKEFDRLCDQRFASGQYRVIDEKEMEGIDAAYDALSEFDRRGVLVRARTVVVPGARPSPAHELPMEHQVVELPPESHPELYEQHAEIEWLRAQIALKHAAGEDPR